MAETYESRYDTGTEMVDIYLHSDKESNIDQLERQGIKLSPKAEKVFMFAGYEVKLTYELDCNTGNTKLVAVDGRKLA